jgi:N-acetyl-D-muramate 6-phosphate phosphatase
MTRQSTSRLAVLFDLDGTLIDSAPDLAGAGNEMRQARGLVPYPYEQLRPMVGAGARGMVGMALNVAPQDDNYATLRDEFLQRYEARMTRQTQVYPDMLPVLAALQTSSIPWGIVTNKAARLSEPLVQALTALKGAATLVCGDTTPHAKPHPEPLLEAARRMGWAPERCIYVGDDLRDVQAGRAAGMKTVGVRWGYLGLGDPIERWGADHIANSPGDLLPLLGIT